MEQNADAADERARRVRHALESLDTDRRKAIVLAYYGGRNCREIALALNLPEGIVRTGVREALVHLHGHLGAQPRHSATQLSR